MIRSADRETANMLKFLRGFRNAADCDLHISGTTLVEDAVICEAYATRIISKLDDLAVAKTAAEETAAPDEAPGHPDAPDPLCDS